MKRLFSLIEEDNGELKATLTTFRSDGSREKMELVDLSLFPGNIVDLFFYQSATAEESADAIAAIQHNLADAVQSVAEVPDKPKKPPAKKK